VSEQRLRAAARAAQDQIPELLALLEAAGDDRAELLDELAADPDDHEAVLARFLRLRLLAAAIAC
jgi:hypothetical protein